MKLFNSVIDNVLTNLQVCKSQFFQALNVSDVTMVNKLLECSAPRQNSPLGLNLGYSAENFLVPQILALDNAETQLFVVNSELAHHLAGRRSY